MILLVPSTKEVFNRKKQVLGFLETSFSWFHVVLQKPVISERLPRESGIIGVGL